MSASVLNDVRLLKPTSATVISALLAAVVTTSLIKLFNGLRAVGYLHGYRVPFCSVSSPGGLIPTSWWNPGFRAGWLWRKSLWTSGENYSLVPFIWGPPTIFTANIDVMKQILTGDRKTSFNKPTEAISSLSHWGENLVASYDGELWRRHRRVVGPAFNNALYQNVWDETLKVYRQMREGEKWADRGAVVDVPSVNVLSTKMALLVIARCGFGFAFEWSAPPTTPDSEMSVQEALRILVDSYIIGFMVPAWIRNLPLRGFDKIRQALEAFSTFMEHEIVARTEEVRSGSVSAEERADAFTMLVRANEQETGKLKLSNREVIGNVFILLFAGHETTAHTLSATLALLALHPKIQNDIFENIISVIGYDRDPVYDDHEKLNKVLAAFYEALRLFPAAYIMMREAVEDTVLNLPNPVGEDGFKPLAVQKGTFVVLDVVGMQYNARYFEDPEEFRPSRWYETNGESEAFSAFSLGPRACIGRKFATVEATAFLTMLLRDWEITPIFQAGETPEMWRSRVLSEPVLGLTLGIRSAPVRMTRRKPC